MRYLRIIFLSLSVFLFLIISAGFIIGKFYEDTVKEYVIQELNNKLNTQIIIRPDDIQFSILKNFPYSSLEFRNVKALEVVPSPQKDTLFKATVISFQFNLIDIFRKNYRVKKIVLTDTHLNIQIDKKGNDNYHFWKSTGDTSQTDFSVELQKLIFKNITIDHADENKKFFYSLSLRDAKLSGEFSSDKYSLNTDVDALIHYIKSDTTVLLSEKPVELHSNLNVNKNTYEITKGNLKLSDLNIELAGLIKEVDGIYDLEMTAKGQDIDIQSVFSLWPEQYKQSLSEYKSEGLFYMDAEIKGKWSNKQTPLITARLGVKNAEVSQSTTNIILSEINLSAHYTNGKSSGLETSALTISGFSAYLEKGRVEGNATISNFNSPLVNAFVRAEFHLSDFTNFLNMDTLENAYGDLKIMATYQGKIATLSNFNLQEYDKSKVFGEFIFENMGFSLKDTPLKFDSLNGSLVLSNRDVMVNGVTGRILKSDLDVNGTFKNMIPHILADDEVMTVNAEVKSDYLDMNELLTDKKETSSSSETPYVIRFSPNINLELNTDIKKLSFRKFEASDLEGIVRLKDKKLMADPLIFKTMDGDISISGIIDANDTTQLLIGCDANLKNINVNKLFYQLENFGQSVITSDNLKGYASVDIKMASVWSPDLIVDTDKIYARGAITITKGELIKFEPLKELSRFIKVSELEHIKFSTLQNQIEVKNQKIFIPRMEIKSSALDITCWGTHSFNNEIDYHIKVLLDELLAKKAIKAKKENDEFGIVEDDGLGKTSLFLSMTGTVDDPVIKYDRKGAADKIRTDIKEEKQNLKAILREEFKWFKKDSLSTTQKTKKKEEEGKFLIKWNEDEKPVKPEDDDF